MLHIGVFCSASDDLDAVYYSEAERLGRWIGQNHHAICYGGTRQGVMERIAISTSKAGGTVIGILPKFMFDNGLASNYADKLIVTADMVERKNTMMQKSDVFVAMPGGFGTLDEIFHVVACGQVGLHCKKVLLLNINHFYDDIIAQTLKARSQRFTSPRFQQGLVPVASVDECTASLSRLAGQAQP